ncbi:metal-dependent transcriptional regulator [Faecalicoccus acidiformans]|uniref:Metal-dependent transcriptional regulator n=1 Tax=Faecalicoccus acidiformans TaxID=915173 RepID=A0ABS2FN60_9FIRM|nr:metal-dependent transcriptional regulator [Faecalicoccus acidiformans]MBM6831367.1 metal-dependent transcriptional regulator [Faecalicoccus acidiformans]MDM8203162.1 metal-dependent transcriptional regulator [Faecalicoccus acidiformans]
MELGESLEDYLESILVLSQKIDPVRSVDVASYLGFSKPSVSHAVKLLEKDGYLQLDKNKYLYLTEEGERIAQETYRRHKFFMEMLEEIGVPRDIAEQDACHMEHVISQVTFDAIQKYYEEKK